MTSPSAQFNDLRLREHAPPRGAETFGRRPRTSAPSAQHPTVADLDPVISGAIGIPQSGSSRSIPSLSGTGASLKSRSKSLVGLQIMTPQQSSSEQTVRSPMASTPVLGSTPFGISASSYTSIPSLIGAVGRSASLNYGGGAMSDNPVTYERGPGNPLFPSSFSSLSAEPNLGRAASVNVLGMGSGVMGMGMGGERMSGGRTGMASVEEWRRAEEADARRRGVIRKDSRAGLSESAITFASESEFSAFEH